MTILVIEDDEGIRNSIFCYLEIADATIVTCADGKHATEWLAVHPPPTVILLDLAMPNMNGWEFRAWQRRHTALRRVPVIALSGFHWTQQQRDELRCEAYLEKPFEMPALHEKICEVYRKTASVREVSPAVRSARRR